MRKGNVGTVLLRGMAGPCIMIVCLMLMLYAMGNVRQGQAEEQIKTVERAIRQAVVSSYATTGAYPDSFEQVKETYGLQIDETKYDIFYEIFADNIMPEITVVPKE